LGFACHSALSVYSLFFTHLEFKMKFSRQKGKLIPVFVIMALGALMTARRAGWLDEKISGDLVILEKVPVVEVLDGDTAKMRVNGKLERVRFSGIDTPEIAHENRDIAEEFYGKEATEYVKKRLSGRLVTLEIQVQKGRYHRGKYGRILAVIWLDKENFNLTLVKEGYAKATSYKGFQYLKEFHAWEKRAKKARRGLWDKPSKRKKQ